MFSCFASSSNNSTLLAETATFHPLIANLFATAAPIPLLAPLMTNESVTQSPRASPKRKESALRGLKFHI